MVLTPVPSLPSPVVTVKNTLFPPTPAGKAMALVVEHEACEEVRRAVNAWLYETCAPVCANCEGTGRVCGYHGVGDVCACPADCPDCR